MTKLEILKKELIYKDEECGNFKQRYLLVDFMYSALGRKSIKAYLELGYKNIGIYGAGVLGRCLFDCIKSTDKDISVEVLDQSGKSDYFGGQGVYLPNDKLELDIIIVTTPTRLFGRICDRLRETGYDNIVSLEEVLYARKNADKPSVPPQGSGQSKKIVYLFDSTYKSIPGIRNKSLMQTKAFCDFGYEAYLVSIVNAAIEIYDYKNDTYKYIGFSDTAEYYKIIFEFIKIMNPEILYVRKQYLLNMFVTDFYKLVKENLPKTKMVLEVPTFPYDNELKGTANEKFIEIDEHYRNCLHEIFDFSTNFNDLDEVLGIKSLKMINGVDIDTVRLKKANKKTEKCVNLVTATSMCYWNGFERLLAGLRDYYGNDYAENGYKVYFHIAGEGPELGFYKSLMAEYNIRDYVKFYGELKGDALNELYDIADFGVLVLGVYKLNNDLASGIRMSEFCAKGLPVIYAGQLLPLFSGLPYLLEFSNDSSVIDVNKIVDHYEKLRKFPEYSRELREYAENNLDWKIFFKRLLTVIGE